MENNFGNLVIMLFSGFLTLVVPTFLLPVTMGAGLFYAMRVMNSVR